MQTEYPIPRHILDSFDIKGLMTKMAKADWYYDYSEDSQVWERGHIEINGIKEDLLQLSRLKNGVQAANYLWDAYVPIYSVTRPSFLWGDVNKTASHQNITTMLENNYDYLSKQIKFTGFGEGHNDELKQKMQEGRPEFQIVHKEDMGNNQTESTLQFRKSEKSGMYFFNNYTLALQNKQHSDPLSQKFYINSQEDNITLKKACNQLNGRAILRELTTKEGNEYKAWEWLNFKETDKHGNFVPKRTSVGKFDLEALLAKHPIRELESPTDKQRLMESLQRGNRQAATLTNDGKDQRIFIEAAPQVQSLKLYDSSGQWLSANRLSETTSAKQEEKQEKKQSQRQGKDGDDEGEAIPQPSKKRGRRKGHGIS